jgi:hypothetical protein
MSRGEDAMAGWLHMLKITAEREYHFARDLIGNPKKGLREALAVAGLKDWRFDFALVDQKIAIEVEGGVFTHGRHTRGSGFTDDCIKYNAATRAGWRVLRYTSAMVIKGEPVSDLRAIYEFTE